MSKAVKAAGLALVIFVTVWVVTLWQWYLSQKPVSSEEVATQLVLLPVGLSAVACLGWWGSALLRQWLARPVGAAPGGRGAPPSPEPSEAGTAADVGGPQPLGMVAIFAEALSLPGGDEAEQALSSLRSGRMRHSLDPHLQDAAGLPVFSSRVADLSTQDWLDAHAEVTDPTLPESLLRAMALIEAPLHRLLSALPLDRGTSAGSRCAGTELASESSGPAFLSGVGLPGALESAARHRQQAVALDIQVWVPAEWPAPHQGVYIDWLRQQAGLALDWAREVGSGEPRWSVEALEAPEAGWDRLRSALQALRADTRPRLLMVLAAHSLLDDAGVTSLQARGELFTAEHQGGRVPGEGAAGLLLANAAMAARCTEVHPWLGVPGVARRQRSADRAGRPGADDLVALARQALAPWGLAAAEVAGQGAWWCLSDADHRPGRASELFEAYQTLQPEGDAMQAVLRLGDAWGDCGVARSLMPVVLAATAVRSGLQPVDDAEPSDSSTPTPTPALVGLLQCSHRRWVIPVWPASVGGIGVLAPTSPDGRSHSSSGTAAPAAHALAA